jgi:Protein of unknown function, DUF481
MGGKVRHRIPLSIAATLVALVPLTPSIARAQTPPPTMAGAPPEPPPVLGRFSGTAVIGLSLESGRTDLNGYQATIQGERPYSKDGTFSVTGSYTKATTKPPGAPSEITVADRIQGDFGVDQNYGKHMVLLVHLQGLRDPIEHVDYEISQLTGFGVRLGNPRATLRIVPGVALIDHDKNIPSENGFNTNVGAYQDLKVMVSKTAVFQQYFGGSHDIEDHDDYVINFDARLTGAITKRYGLQLSYHYEYESLLYPGTQPSYQKIMAGLQITF